VWAFRITETGDLADKRLLKKFDDFGFDGMRCDVDGNLYITRHGKGTVAVVSPAGELIREIDVLGSKPSNLCFGGLDGRTVYVTEVDHQRIVEFLVERPGLEWQRWQK
jgi:sugar lactone lactonase YvrE